jgi:hypothetical protein
LRRVDELIPVLWQKLDGVVRGNSRQRTDAFEQRSSIPAPGPKPICTTVRYLVVQSIAGQKPFMAFDNVPFRVSHFSPKQAFKIDGRVSRKS